MALSITATKQLGALDDIFAKVAHVYYSSTVLNTTPSSSVTVDMEFPVIDDSVSFDTGGIDKTEVKLTTGQIWTSKASKSDSAITMQVASLDADVASLFMTATNGGYALDVKKSTGALYFVDETGKGIIILPNVEIYGSLVVGEGDNPAYFNATVTPLINNAGVSIYLDVSEAEV